MVTNAHVVNHDKSVEAVLHNGQTVIGHVIGIDEFADIAYISLELGDSSKSIRPLELGDPRRVSVGQEVMAIGYPLTGYLGARMIVTKGIISDIHRRGVYQMVQTDSPSESRQ